MNISLVDVAITATLRPALLRTSLDSWRANLWRDYPNLRCVLNVDPVGEPGVQATDIIDICKDYFTDIHQHVAAEGNHARALRWAWGHCTAPYVLAIEDDWKLMGRRDLGQLVRLMDSHTRLGCFRFSVWPASRDRMVIGNRRIPWNGEFFQWDPAGGGTIFGTSPSLMRREFAHDVVRLTSDDHCPEKWLKGDNVDSKELHAKWDFGFSGHPNDPPDIVDLGRAWMQDHGLKRDSVTDFVHWLTIGGGSKDAP